MNLIQLSIKRPIFLIMVTAFFIVLGAIALKKLAIDLYPNVTYPVLVVRADLPGAAPEEVEQLITKRMEDALSTLSGLKTVRSVSREGTAIVSLEFELGTDVRFQEIQVRGKIGNLRRSLPDTMLEPSVSRQDPDDTPIIEVAVTGNRAASEITKIADDVLGLKLRQIPGVGEVDLNGDREPEIAVDVRPEALESLKLNITDVVQAIKKANRNDPIGGLQGAERKWVVRSVAQAKASYQLGDIAVARGHDGQPIFLRDVAKISDGFEEVTRVSRIGDANGLSPAVLLQVIKQSGENTVAISDRVRQAIREVQDSLPPDIKLTITQDSADLVRSNVADVEESLIIGAILTVLVVLVFLGSPRSTITTGLSLPSSVITTFAVMAVAGFTINVMTLLALSLAVGLLIDDAIVVRENIFRRLQEPGVDPKKAAFEGAREVQLAVVATTLTVVAVFVPVGFMGGVSGQFFKQFALTVVFAILVSLWDAMTMAPLLSAYFANKADTLSEWKAFGKAGQVIHAGLMKVEHGFDHLVRGYGRLLAFLLPRPAIALGSALIAVALAAWGFVAVKKGFIPAQLGQRFSVNVQGPLAVTIPRAVEVGTEVDQRIRTVKGLANWTVNAGTGFNGSVNINVNARVADDAAKDQKTLAEIRQAARDALAGMLGYSVRVSEPSDPLAGSTGRFQPIAVVVAGDEIAQINQLAKEVRRIMAETPGITDVSQSQEEGLPEVVFRVDPRRAALYNLDAQTISASLTAWVQGDTSNSLKIGDDQIPIRVRLLDGERLPPDRLLALNLYQKAQAGAKAGAAVPLGNVVEKTAGAGPALINRESRQRVVRVGANLDAKAALGDVVEDLQARLADLPLPSGYSAKISGQSEQMDELFANVTQALALGSLFVFMVLASLFESILLPWAVMVAIPLAATGAVLSLMGFGMPLDLYGGIGIILLAGIVAKNSILLVDFAALRVREMGEKPYQAILEAAPLRLRPIVMTSIAMIAGMIPVAFGLGSGGQARQTLGVATIGGVISSTALTLLVVPNFYLLIAQFSDWLKRRFHAGT